MRAWLLLLAVLATFQPFVQVASTEDTSIRFVKAISPRKFYKEQEIKGLITNNSNNKINNYKNNYNKNNKNIQIKISTTKENQINRFNTTSNIKTALMTAFNPVYDIQTLTTSTAASSFISYNNTDRSDNNNNSNKILENQNNNNNNSDNIIIEIKNIEEIEKNNQEKVLKTNNSNNLNKDNKEEKEREKIEVDEMAVKESAKLNTNKKTKINQNKRRNGNNLNKKYKNNDNNNDDDDDGDDDEPETYSNKEILSETVTPDPSTLVGIENSLLSLFNMKRPPKIDRSKIVIPEAMKQLYAQIMGHELDTVNIPKPGLFTKSANTVRSFTHKSSKIDDRFPHHHRFRLYFDITSIPSEEKLKAAELQLSRDAISHAALHPRQAKRTRYQVLVYDIIRPGIRGKEEPSFLLLDNKTVRLNSTDTMSLDVQPAIDRWLDQPKRNFGLLIEVRTFGTLRPAPHHHVRLRRSADEQDEQWQQKQPLLFTYTDDGRHKSRSIRDVSTRSKRAGHHRRPHRRKNNDEICRRHSLYVDFTDVGWSDWIVAPPGYDAFYCHGKCPFPLAEHLNSTNHAVVQTLVNNINPGKAPKACCVPTQLEGISMLYLNDQNTVVLKNYQDMTAVGCGCR